MQSSVVGPLAFAQTDSIFNLFVQFVINYSLVYMPIVQLLVYSVGIKRQDQVSREEENVFEARRRAINMPVRVKVNWHNYY